jgi:hypothetical protein
MAMQIRLLFFLIAACLLPACASGQAKPGRMFARYRVVLLADATHAPFLAAKIERLAADLKREGWEVRRLNAARTETPENIKNRLRNLMDSDPKTFTAAFLLGHIPVLNAWVHGPDGHGWFGAAPADTYYVDRAGSYVKEYKQGVTACAVHGSMIPNAAVGRVDFYGINGKDNKNDEQAERADLARYLDRDHAYRTGALKTPFRAIVYHNGPWKKTGMAVAGALFKPGEIDEIAANSPPRVKKPYRLFVVMPGPSTNGEEAVFGILYRSFCWNWGVPHALLRQALAKRACLLAIAWGPLNLREMAGGEPIGVPIRGAPVICPTLTLQGDPTLRLRMGDSGSP